MPNVVIPLANVNETVSRPLINDLTKQLKKLINLGHVDDTRILNYNGSIKTFDTEVGAPQARYASFAGKTRLIVEAEEDFNENGWASSVIDKPNHVPLLIDNELGVAIVQVIVPCDLTLKFKFQTSSQDEAQRWRNDIVARLGMLREGSQHMLNFHVCLQPQVWGLMHEIHKRREALDGYGDEFQVWVKEHSSFDIDLISDATGEKPTLAYARKLDRVNGRFDVSPFPEKPTYDESGGTWECTLSYKITYDRPTHCRVWYPIQIHQQLLDDKYVIPENYPSNMNDRKKSLTMAQKAFSIFESYALNGYHSSQDAYIRIPAFDDFVYRIVPVGTATIMLGLLALEKTGNQVLLNLGDLGEEQVDEDILQFLREVEYPWMTKPYESFFMLNLYRDEDLVVSSSLTVDDKLNVWSTDDEDITLRKNYRVRLALVIDPSLLPYSAFERLFNYPKVIQKLILAINDAIRFNTDLQDRLKLKTLKPWEFEKLWWLLQGFAPVPQDSYGHEQPGQKNPGKHFGIPDDVYNALTKTLRMRTVQIQGTMIAR